MAKKKLIRYSSPTTLPLQDVKPGGRHPHRHSVITANGGHRECYTPCALCGDTYHPKAQKRGADWAFDMAVCQRCSDNGNLAKAGLKRYAEFVALHGYPIMSNKNGPVGYVPGGWNLKTDLRRLIPHYLTLMKYARKHFGRKVGLADLLTEIKNDPDLA